MDEGEGLVQRRVERHGGEPVAVAEGVEQRAGDQRVADSAGGELERGVGVLDLDAWPDRDSGALGAFGELTPRRVLVAPAGLGQHEDGRQRSARWSRRRRAGRDRAGVDDLELGDRGADFEPFVVDRQRDQAGFEASRAHRVDELDGVLADDAHGDVWMAAHEVLDEPGKEEAWAVLNVPRDAVPPVSARARRTTSAASPAAASVRSASGRSSRPGVGELQAAAGAYEERDAEFGFQVSDLLGDARAGQVEDVSGGSERAVLGRRKEVGELLERHAVRRHCLRHAQSISSRSLRGWRRYSAP